MSRTDLEARTAQGLRIRDLQTRVHGMVNTLADMDEQLEDLLEAIEGKDVAGPEEIGIAAADVWTRIDSLLNRLQRPPPNMGYRQWPRLAERLSFVTRGVVGAQARLTEGQREAVSDVAAEVEARALELRELIAGPITDLNRMLEGQGKILPGWERSPAVSLPRCP